MRQTHLGSKLPETGRRRGLVGVAASVVLRQLGVALVALNAYGQAPPLSSPRELLETDPRGFAQWLKTNQPTPMSPGQKARILASLPRQGELTDLDAPSRRKLASLSPLLRANGHELAYQTKVIDAPQVRIGLYLRTVVLITKTALTLLEAEELQAQVAHEIGHQYVWADYADATARGDHRRLKDLELSCDAIAIVTLHGLAMDPSRLMTGVEKITQYNLTVRKTSVDDSNYPTLSERREFARSVIARVRASPPRSTR
jgi:hypothetical protein